MSSMILKSGIDLVEIQRLESQREAIRNRFIQRVFTPLEQADADCSAATLAGRFAAKEAVAKALGVGIGPVSWKEIEIQRGDQGEPKLQLTGKAAELSSQLGIQQWSVSISHTHTHAVAVAVALGLNDDSQEKDI